MGLFDKLKKFLFGPFKPARKKRRKKPSSRRAPVSNAKRKSVSKKKKTSAPSVKGKSASAPPAKRQSAVKPVKPVRAPKSLKKVKSTDTKAAGREAVRSAASASPRAKTEAPGVYLGAISHYFAKVRAAVIPLEETLSVGDKIVIHNAVGPLFRQAVKSLQINRIPIDEGRPGEEVGLEVVKHVSVGDKVFRLKAGR